MKIKKILKNNEGFTLVEFIIVIAIIVLMTTASYISMNVLQTARAKDASSSFETALADTISRDKNIGVDYDLNGVIDDSEKKYAAGLKIYYYKGSTKNKLYLQKCIFIAQADGSYALWNLSDSDPYIKSVNPNDGKGISLTRDVKVKYTSVSGTEYSLSGYGSFTICFNKKGECVTGYGTYAFSNKRGVEISRVQVNKNGGYVVSGSKNR